VTDSQFIIPYPIFMEKRSLNHFAVMMYSMTYNPIVIQDPISLSGCLGVAYWCPFACNFNERQDKNCSFAQTQHRVRNHNREIHDGGDDYEVDSDDEKGQHERDQIDDLDDPAQL
jgi:hypothetical protein